MKASILLCAALAGMLPDLAEAQGAPDEVRCWLLSVSYAGVTKDVNARRTAAMTGAFYLGRVSSHLSGAALSAAIRAQGRGLPAKQAGAVMRACTDRAAAAQQQLTAAARQAGIGG